MPKLMTVTLQVEEEAVGSTLIALKKMRGIADIDLDLEKRRRGKANGADPAEHTDRGVGTIRRNAFGKSGREFAIEMLTSGRGPVRQSIMKEAFVAQGRSEHSISSVLHNLTKDGLAKATGDGYIATKKLRDRMRWKNKGSKKKK